MSTHDVPGPDGPGEHSPPSGAGQPAPHPAIAGESRTWAALTHLSAFVGAWAFLAFAGPLVMWLLKRHEDPFVEHHGREALNFNLTVLVVGVVGALLAIPITIATLGLGLIVLVPLAAAIALAWLVLTIVAAVRASDGEAYRYPMTIRFVR